MRADAPRRADTRGWLNKARTDLRSARVDLDASPPILTDALFHCQQAVEKALKAYLTWHDEPFRKTHDLGELGRQCLQFEPLWEPWLRDVAPLTEYAWRYRYPGDVDDPSIEEAESALAQATDVVERITAGIGSV